MSSEQDAVEAIPRHELIALALEVGVERPEQLTTIELAKAIEQRADSATQASSERTGWFTVARHLVANVVEQGLNLPDAARAIRAGGGETRAVAPVQRAPLSTLTLAQIYLAQGHRSRARKVLEEVVSREPQNAEARAMLAGLKEAKAKGQVQLDFEAAVGAALSANGLASDVPGAGSEADASGEGVAMEEERRVTLPAASAIAVDVAESAVGARQQEAAGTRAPAVEEVRALPPLPEAEEEGGQELGVEHEQVVALGKEPPAGAAAPLEGDGVGLTPLDEERDELVLLRNEEGVYACWELGPASVRRGRRGELAILLRTFEPSQYGARPGEHRFSVANVNGVRKLELSPQTVVRAALMDVATGEVLSVASEHELRKSDKPRLVWAPRASSTQEDVARRAAEQLGLMQPLAG